MYSYLAGRISGKKMPKKATLDNSPGHIFERATSGERFTIDNAITIRDTYFPGELLERLFVVDEDTDMLTVSDAVKIMRNTFPLEVMPDIADAILNYTHEKIEYIRVTQGTVSLIGWGLAVGRAAGVREERARRRSVSETKE